VADPTHPAHDLFEAVHHAVAGGSCAGAHLFGAATSAHTTGMELVKDNPIAASPAWPACETSSTSASRS